VCVPPDAVTVEFRYPPLAVPVEAEIHRPRSTIVRKPVGDGFDDVPRGVDGVVRLCNVGVAAVTVRYEARVDATGCRGIVQSSMKNRGSTVCLCAGNRQ